MIRSKPGDRCLPPTFPVFCVGRYGKCGLFYVGTVVNAPRAQSRLD